MLEFQEGFFEPEIREGFFVDSTMKTVWAAEMEVLQTVAEICEKHGLTWYAGFGTMLGAIRHEGYIPWDDDLDIMMMRGDYMKLMKVLPEELPEGYRFRSPFSEEGYTEYHTNIINGSGISIEPDFLQRFHNCPFTVGVDIFPLDYLPRNKSEREIQKYLFTLAGRVTQMARNILGGFKIETCDKGKSKEDCISEMKTGIKQLEKLCRVKLDYSLIEKEDWEAVMTQAWQLANKIAMMYGPKDSDYIVMYGDYITWEHKVYPKSWFKEVYGATFESFMLPIPNGYDEILRTVYGDYNIRIRNAGMHEYPYYARQLRQLREYVRNIEDRAAASGIGKRAERSDNILPTNWEQLTKDRKVVLFIDDMQLSAEFHTKGLDKLESVLNTFRDSNDKVVLWWRPQSQMRTLLGLISRELVERYDKILNDYKMSGWGICDESDNEERAKKYCDAYYGEMNAVARDLQGQKPVMIEKLVGCSK